MSLHFHPLTVKEVRRETPDCVSVLFDVPELLKKQFAFRQGQNVTLRKHVEGEEVRRTYSICSSPLENELRIAVKKQPGGLFSTYINDLLKPGDVLDVMEPAGRFYTPLHPGQKKKYLAFAAGSGITPVISILKTTLAVEKESRFTLIYGNRNRSSIIFLEELEALKNKYLTRFQLFHILSREHTDVPLFNGRMDEEKLKELDALLLFTNYDEFFICGPEKMIFCIKDFLEGRGIDKKNIHFELFTTSSRNVTRQQKKYMDIKTDVSRVTLISDGRAFHLEIPARSEQTILEAAISAGADVPFACKGGMCCTCKAFLREGKVQMDVHWGLEDEEVEKGYILTCQSIPLSETLVVDFDTR
ncbi:MAG: phenylacetate-CoA oxygenase/reductase subunit PaaK [Chitinophagaceae bacterium]|nr:phenylacetate-CoA oxygenase/reductase subunit PaaK [Chitinophagaceae bacterium]